MAEIRIWDTVAFRAFMGELAMSYDSLHLLMVQAMKDLGFGVKIGDKMNVQRRLEFGNGPSNPEYELILSRALADVDLTQFWLMLPDKAPGSFSDEAVRMAFGGKNPLEKQNG